MTKPTHNDIDVLIKNMILPFCHIRRDIPLPIGERRWENDAEHSWSVAFLACALAPKIDPKLDLGKIAQYAIVHDLVEVYAKDTSVFAPSKELASKAQREELSLERIAKEFAHFPWIAQTIKEYESRSTDEAKFVYSLDKYIPVAYDYIDEGRLFHERRVTLSGYNESMSVHQKKAKAHPEIGKYYDEVRDLLNSHPDYFHTKI